MANLEFRNILYALFLSGALLPPATGVAAEARCEALGQASRTDGRESTFNPGNVLTLPREFAETGLLCDGVSLGWSWQIRGAASYRRDTSDAEETDAKAALRQFYRRFDFDSPWSLTVGRKPYGWDVSYVAQPLDFLGEKKDVNDFEDRLSQLTPSIFASLDYAAERTTWSVIVGENRLYEDKRAQVILGSETDLGGTNLQFVAQKPFDQPWGAGSGVSTVIGNALELHGSLFARRGTERPIHIGVLNDEFRFYQPAEAPVADYRLHDDKWYPRWVIGGHWTAGSGLNVLIEWMYDRRGLSPGQWQHLLAMTRFHQAGATLGVPPQAIAGNLGFDAASLSRGGTMREYVFLRLAQPFGQVDAEVNSLVNAFDVSAALGTRITYKASPRLQLWVDARWSVGRSGTEFGEVPISREQMLAFRYFFGGIAP